MNFTLDNFKLHNFHLCLFSKLENHNYIDEQEKNEEFLVFNPALVIHK